MKNWSGQLFPISLLALLAALSFWLQVSLTPVETGKPPRHDKAPDAFAENLQIRRLDANGELKYRLSAPYLQHFPDDDSSEIRNPELIAYRSKSPPITLTAGSALVGTRAETVVLSDTVRIVRPEHGARAELVAETSRMNINLETGLAETDQPVHISQGNSWFAGTGARFDNNASTYELKSQVRGHYLAHRAKP